MWDTLVKSSLMWSKVEKNQAACEINPSIKAGVKTLAVSLPLKLPDFRSRVPGLPRIKAELCIYCNNSKRKPFQLV
jgi:hypothetical protein